MKNCNSDAELIHLQNEFKNWVEFKKGMALRTAERIEPEINTMASAIQHSDPNYSLVIPHTNLGTPVEGGVWVPALVYIPYR